MSYGYVPAPMPPMPVQQPSWFSRNWKWFLPTVIVGPILLIVVFVGGLFTVGMSVIKSSEPYQYAVSTAVNDARVTEQLGAPITPGWYAGGRFNASNRSYGDVNLFIPLNGKLRHGTLYVAGVKSAGVWRYQRLQVVIDGKPGSINLLSSPSPSPSTEPDDEDK
ncbi:MAG TPA: cytochrome c oxidase assembly factor Coa1 family protein [Candidatus Angelobacter sp.]|jgi:hypothetical protein|nr:cytochrome c oxidase assembly factor Coa1 family protein [Candidatus Angelobacter sp.]